MTKRVNWLDIFFGLFCVSLLVSMSAMDAFASFIFLGVLIKYRAEIYDLRVLIPKKLWIFFGVWILVISGGLLLNLEHNPPIFKRIFEFKWILFLFTLTVYFQFNLKLKLLKRSLVFVSGASIAYCFLAVLLQKDFFQDLGPGEMFRVGGFFGNPMTFAHAFQFFLCGAFAYMIVCKKLRLLSYVLFMTSFAVLMFTQTRGVWIAVVIALVLGLIFELGKKSLKPIFGFLVAFGLFCAVYTPIRERIQLSFDPEKSYDSERLVLWKTNFQIFFESPLLGVGYGENKRRLREYYDKFEVPEGQFEGHAHNQYLHFLAGTGLLGFACYLFLVFYFLRLNYVNYQASERASESRAILLGLLVGQIAFYIGGMTESNFEHAKLKYVLCLVWALVLYFENQRTQKLNHVLS